jgi:hypothetical protein
VGKVFAARTLIPAFGLENFPKSFEFSTREPQPRSTFGVLRIFFVPPGLDSRISQPPDFLPFSQKLAICAFAAERAMSAQVG